MLTDKEWRSLLIEYGVWFQQRKLGEETPIEAQLQQDRAEMQQRIAALERQLVEAQDGQRDAISAFEYANNSRIRAQQEWTNAHMRAERLRAALAGVDFGLIENVCPWCGSDLTAAPPPDDHAPNCRFVAALAAEPSPTPLRQVAEALAAAPDGHSEACAVMLGGACDCWQSKRAAALALLAELGIA